MKTLFTILFFNFLFSIFLYGFESEAQNDTTYIYLKDYGLYKTKKKNAIKFFQKVKEDLNGNHPKVLVFSTGTYHFYPDGCETRIFFESNTTNSNPITCAFLFENVNNLVIDGRGSHLIFHEQMQPFTFNNCRNIKLKNVVIDWTQPFIAQGEVLRVTDQFIDLGINPKESPYNIQNDQLYFNINRNNSNQWKSTLEFDRRGRYIVPETGDNGCLGENWNQYYARPTMPGIVRLYNKFDRKPKTGNYLVLRHAEHTHAGVFIQDSENITIENLRLYHATGQGVLAQFSKNLTFNAYKAIPNRAKNRYFSGGDDGLHISNCAGQVDVNKCEFEGLMDDAVNVHGTYVQVQEIISGTQLRCKFMHRKSVGLNWGHAGDEIQFIEKKSMTTLGIGSITDFKPIDKEYFILTVKSNIPDQLKIGDVLENLTWTPDLTIKNTHFKNCRARGLLVSTSGKVLIENNIFESSGSAILIAGDAKNRFESGTVTNVSIRYNTFKSICNTNPSQFCEGIISIYPIIPQLDQQTICFHRNIKIENNTFHPFDFPILFSFSVDGITFANNTVVRNYDFSAYHNRQYNFTFEACKNIRIVNNKFSDDLLGKSVLLKGTSPQELSSDLDNTFKIEQF